MKRNASRGEQHGFTLMELMMTITVLGVLTALAVPSFTTMTNKNRLASESNELLSGIQCARMEAIRTNSKVTFCGAANSSVAADADCGTGVQPYWVVIGNAAGGGQQQLRVFEVKEPLQVSTALTSISFSADGLARDSATHALVSGTITVCLPATKPAQNKRVLNIASGSRVNITTPTADGGGTCS